MIKMTAQEYERIVAQRAGAVLEVGRLRGFIPACADIVDENPDFVRRHLKLKAAEIAEISAAEREEFEIE